LSQLNNSHPSPHLGSNWIETETSFWGLFWILFKRKNINLHKSLIFQGYGCPYKGILIYFKAELVTAKLLISARSPFYWPCLKDLKAELFKPHYYSSYYPPSLQHLVSIKFPLCRSLWFCLSLFCRMGSLRFSVLSLLCSTSKNLHSCPTLPAASQSDTSLVMSYSRLIKCCAPHWDPWAESSFLWGILPPLGYGCLTLLGNARELCLESDTLPGAQWHEGSEWVSKWIFLVYLLRWKCSLVSQGVVHLVF
jgi:hypothetical protein